MANDLQADYNLQNIAFDGFDIIEKHFGRRSLQSHPAPPPQRPQELYHHHQKVFPNQYSYPEPDQAHAAAKETAFRSHRPAPTKHYYETWYFVPVPQAPKQEAGNVISSLKAAESYGGMLFRDYGYKSKPAAENYGGTLFSDPGYKISKPYPRGYYN
ncbi:hypothetical protein DITRI_Ditri15bG0126800 [Diplodiscus trichospermus]